MKVRKFKNLTKQQKLCLFFKENNYNKVKSQIAKYTVFTNNSQYIFVGKNGAVRINSRNSVSGSISFTKRYDRILREFEKSVSPERKIILK